MRPHNDGRYAQVDNGSALTYEVSTELEHFFFMTMQKTKKNVKSTKLSLLGTKFRYMKPELILFYDLKDKKDFEIGKISYINSFYDKKVLKILVRRHYPNLHQITNYFGIIWFGF